MTIINYLINSLHNGLVNYCLAPVFYFLDLRRIDFPYYAIGHLGTDPDSFLKEGLLGMREKFSPVWFIESNLSNKKVANYHLLNYWKKYFIIIENSFLCSLLSPLKNGYY